MTDEPDPAPPPTFIVWITAGALGAGALLALVLAHG
jgi:hypothetical protein